MQGEFMVEVFTEEITISVGDDVSTFCKKIKHCFSSILKLFSSLGNQEGISVAGNLMVLVG